MRATVIHAPHDIRVEEVPDPAIQQPTDVVVRVLRACICGSDLWAYRGEAARQPGQRIGHEFLGVVEEAGSEVTGVRPGDLVVAPVRLVRRHLRVLPARACTPPARTAASGARSAPTAARARPCASRSPTAPSSSCPADAAPTTGC